MKVHSCKFVLSSELFEGVDDDYWEQVSDELGKTITWGDANRTMIAVEDMLDVVGESSNQDEDYRRFSDMVRERLINLPDDVHYIDLEN